jgi:hypothetical protein
MRLSYNMLRGVVNGDCTVGLRDSSAEVESCVLEHLDDFFLHVYS